MPLDWKSVDEEGVIRREKEVLVGSVGYVTQYSHASVSDLEWSCSINNDDVMKTVLEMIKNCGRRDSTLPKTLRPLDKVSDEVSLVAGKVNMRGYKNVPPSDVWKSMFDIAHEGHVEQTVTKKV
ncbi:hypothetical protein NDU88_003932 [Pleurodeles waltl]|uniref:Uncharacterized protein n=1 Tax=Pleurodeles waltl TaxID=8319 RepID=A0AAV7QB46_PLEWA|nr:hypothetical protein NDU88_003932 [Pleurodeles waltl]